MQFNKYKQSFNNDGFKLNKNKRTLYFTKEISELNNEILGQCIDELEKHVLRSFGHANYLVDVSIGRFLVDFDRIRFFYPSFNSRINKNTIQTNFDTFKNDIIKKCDLDLEKIQNDSIDSKFKFDSLACIEFTVTKRF